MSLNDRGRQDRILYRNRIGGRQDWRKKWI